MYRCLGAIGFILRFSTIINLPQIPPHWLNDICSSTIGNKRWTFVKFGGRREELVCGSLFVLCPSIYHVGDCCFVVLRKTSASSRYSLYWGRKIHSWKSWPTFFGVAEISKLLCRCFDRRGADILRSYPQSRSGSSITKIVLPKTGKGMVNWKRIVQKESLPSFKSFLYTAKRTVCNSLGRRMACHYDEWLVTMTNDLSLCHYQIKKMSKNWEKTVSSKMFISRVWIWLIKYFYFKESRDQLPSAFTTVKKGSTKISKTKGICNKSSRLIQIVLVKFWFFFIFWTLI